jgi:hypothetical protein
MAAEHTSPVKSSTGEVPEESARVALPRQRERLPPSSLRTSPAIGWVSQVCREGLQGGARRASRQTERPASPAARWPPPKKHNTARSQATATPCPADSPTRRLACPQCCAPAASFSRERLRNRPHRPAAPPSSAINEARELKDLENPPPVGARPLRHAYRVPWAELLKRCSRRRARLA